jgi:hypothetical protein
MKAQASTRPSCGDGRSWRVVDDLARDYPVIPAELDAVEAFLMPLVHALLAGESNTQPGKTIPDNPPMPTPTHKRRNELRNRTYRSLTSGGRRSPIAPRAAGVSP